MSWPWSSSSTGSRFARAKRSSRARRRQRPHRGFPLWRPLTVCSEMSLLATSVAREGSNQLLMGDAMSAEFQISAQNAAALFTLKLHRGDGMALLAMNCKSSKRPQDFVGFAIEYREPGGTAFFALKNRLAFGPVAGGVNDQALSTR